MLETIRELFSQISVAYPKCSFSDFYVSLTFLSILNKPPTKKHCWGYPINLCPARPGWLPNIICFKLKYMTTIFSLVFFSCFSIYISNYPKAFILSFTTSDKSLPHRNNIRLQTRASYIRLMRINFSLP